MPAGVNPQVDVASFLRAIVKSGLLDKGELEAALASIPREQRRDAAALADLLVEAGTLSAFQVQKLLKGVTVGLIIDRFHIISPIGKGGMGTVYLARDSRSGGHVALKILPPKKAREEERMVTRFRREMEISQKVDHPHVARTYEAGEFKGVHYIAMEYIPGQTLYRLVQDGGPLPVQDAALLFAEAAAGLGHAHGQGVIHRDIKPSNIMVTPQGHAKVLDLGLALLEGEETDEVEVVGGRGYIVGSMDYIAPEQTRDAAAIDGRADIYGLGCALFFALTGRPPFPGGTSKEKVHRHRAEAPPDVRSLNPKVPESFADIVHRMMAKSPVHRYQTAGEVERALRGWAPDRAATAPRVGVTSLSEAVRRLQEKPVSSEIIDEPILPADYLRAKWADFLERLSDWLPITEDNWQYYLVGACIVAFWIVVLLCLGLGVMFF